MKKKLLILITFILICFPCIVSASTNTLPRDENNLYVWDTIDKNKYKNDILKTPRVDSSEKIYDFADLYTDEEEKKLFDRVNDYIEKNGVDLVILTINENNKINTERYAEDFFIYNYFGTEDKKRTGIVFIIDMDGRNVNIVTSGSAILYLDDNRINNILDDIVGYIGDKEYYDGTNVLMSKLEGYGTSIPSSNSHITIDPNGKPVKVHRPNIFISLVGGVIVAWIFVASNKSKHKSIIQATDADLYMNTGKSSVAPPKDKLVSSVVTSHVISTSSNSGGGGSHIGGSSFHVGGGGHSFGGGGRHF